MLEHRTEIAPEHASASIHRSSSIHRGHLPRPIHRITATCAPPHPSEAHQLCSLTPPTAAGLHGPNSQSAVTGTAAGDVAATPRDRPAGDGGTGNPAPGALQVPGAYQQGIELYDPIVSKLTHDEARSLRRLKRANRRRGNLNLCTRYSFALFPIVIALTCALHLHSGKFASCSLHHLHSQVGPLTMSRYP